MRSLQFCFFLFFLTFSFASRSYFPGGQLNTIGWTDRRRAVFGQADLLVPLVFTKNHLFLCNGRYTKYRGPAFQIDVGLGYRQRGANWMWGIFGYLDHRKTEKRNRFQQITSGFEIKSCAWSLRCFGYIPLGTREHIIEHCQDVVLSARLVPTKQNQRYHIELDNGEIQKKQKTLYGAELELGYAPYSFLELFAAGRFFGDQDKLDSKAFRTKARFDVGSFLGQKENCLSIEGIWQIEDHKRNQGYIGLDLTLAFGGKKMRPTKCLAKRMLQRPRTDLGMFIAREVSTTSVEKKFYATESAPAVVSIATDPEELEEALLHADIIGVVEQIQYGNQITLRPGQKITGGLFTLAEGVSLVLGEKGSLVLDQPVVLNTNNEMTHLTLSSSGGLQAPVIVNQGGSVGKFVFDDNTVHGYGMGCIDVTINDDSQDSIVELTNNYFDDTVSFVANRGVVHGSLIEDNRWRLDSSAYRGLYFENVEKQGVIESICCNQVDSFGQVVFKGISIRNTSVGDLSYNGIVIRSFMVAQEPSCGIELIADHPGLMKIGTLHRNDILYVGGAKEARSVQITVAPDTIVEMGSEGGVYENRMIYEGNLSENVYGFFLDTKFSLGGTVYFKIKNRGQTLVGANEFFGTTEDVHVKDVQMHTEL